MLGITIQIFAVSIILALAIHGPIFLWILSQDEKSKQQGALKKNPDGEVSYFEVLKASTKVLDAYGDFTESTEGLLKRLQQTPPGTEDREFLIGVLNKLITTYTMIEKDKLNIIEQLKQINEEVDYSYQTCPVGTPSGGQVRLSQPCI